MPKIFEMSPHLADLIAAGEVVERPASVVKELCENSIDAGALSLTVEIRGGGMTCIRVTDNGSGIADEDTETAFLRHATSKLRDERGLEAIGTLGFRGEALAAISSVSRMELLTREAGSDVGTRLTLDAGKVTSHDSAGCPVGTTMIVRDLFFNTPARQKYMKNDKAEGAAVTAAVARIALSHPEVSLLYIKDGREELHTPGDGRIDSAVYSVLGRDAANGLLAVKGGQEGAVEVSGFISAPAACRGNRQWQFFFLNGRAVRNRILQTALEQGYKNSLFTGRFPVCVINLKMPLGQVDVNVHPAKLEVRFENEKQVFDAVYWAVRGALETQDRPAPLSIPAAEPDVVNGHSEPVRASEPSPVREEKLSGGFSFRPAVGPAYQPKPQGDQSFRRMTAGQFKAAFGARDLPGTGAGSGRVALHDPQAENVQTKITMPPVRPAWTPDEPIRREPQEQSWRYIGEAMACYLIVEKGTSLYLIDKHAAHERIIFDRLKARDPESFGGQTLIAPLIVKPGQAAAQVILENDEFLSSLGFEISDFGGGALAVRSVPVDMDTSDPGTMLEEIAEKLAAGNKKDVETRRDDILHTVACKAAIKAGKRTDPATLSELIEKVLSGEVRYCPHGRPVCMELSKYQLDKNFKRV
ncbi:MAG: DNA mismatch repair endonuclease MutL [Oscillospiraceae bacterium]|nr:DNA mismatch repair endonuclease MutL [Oscillospiraceae bacterium]